MFASKNQQGGRVEVTFGSQLVKSALPQTKLVILNKGSLKWTDGWWVPSRIGDEPQEQ